MPAVEASGETAFDDFRYTGSLGRSALFPIEEVPFDLDVDFSNLSVVDDAGAFVKDASSHSAFWNSAQPGLIHNFYDLYFDDLGQQYIVGGTGERNVLLVSNSYAAAIQRFLAQGSTRLRNYRDVQPGGDHIVGTRLSDRLEATGADTVIFLASPKDFASAGLQNPTYFD